MRLRSDIVVAALIRTAGAAGAPAVLQRRGAAEAGAIYVVVDGLDGTFDLYGPAPAGMTDEKQPGERLFMPVLAGCDPDRLAARLDQEARFDPDFFIVVVEDRERRPFVPVIAVNGGRPGD